MYEALHRDSPEAPSDGVVLHVHDSEQGEYKRWGFNGPLPTEFESENFKGRILCLLRPASSYGNKDNGEAYPWKQHFHGRKRLWEWRLQGRFKQQPSVLYAGIELEEYVHHNLAARTLTRGILPLVQRALECKDVIHELGNPDDQDLRPVVVAPIWAADNTLVTTPPGDAPDITMPTIPVGFSRKASRQYWEALWSGRGAAWDPGTVYTFCIWGPSPLLDMRRMVFRKLPMMWGEIPWANFCGHQPVHVVAYELVGDASKREHRQGNKTYTVDIRLTPEALWETQNAGNGAEAKRPAFLQPLALTAEHLEALDSAPSAKVCRSESFCSAVSHISDTDTDRGSASGDPPEPSLEPPLMAVPAAAAIACDAVSHVLVASQIPPAQCDAREALLPQPISRQEETAGWLNCWCRRRRRRPTPDSPLLEVV